MMKKILKYFCICTLLSIIVLNFTYNVAAYNTDFSKGDLRCPLDSENCVEIKDDVGNVIGVNVTKSNNDVQITKMVKKTDVLGQYEIKFNVKGRRVTQSINKPVRIMLILDASESIGSDWSKYVVPASKVFANQFSPLDNDTTCDVDDAVCLALIKFNYGVKGTRVFQSKNFEDYNFGGTSSQSKLNLALQLAADDPNYFSQFDNQDVLKYIVVFGDGFYGQPVEANGSDGFAPERAQLSKLREKGVQFYMVVFDGEDNEYYMRDINEIINYNNDNWILVNDNEQNGYEEAFKEIANRIKNNISNSSKVGLSLTDYVGDEFEIIDGGSKYYTFNFEEVSQNGVDTESFYIKIDDFAETGWHNTNSKFEVSYSIGNNFFEMESFENPEVYWVQKKININSCSGSITTDTIDEVDVNNYYKKKCYEGYYDENNEYVGGYTAKIVVNDLPNGVVDYNLMKGLGFTTKIDLNTNIKCRYEFAYEDYLKKYDETKHSINNTTDEKEKQLLQKELNELDLILEKYMDLIEEDLSNYKKSFFEQTAKMSITYDNTAIQDEVDFIDLPEQSEVINCFENETQIINDKSVIVNQTCIAHFSKKMQLESTCIDMTTGEPESCAYDDKNQINGGNKYYTNMNHYSGKVYVKIPNAGYLQQFNIELDDPEDDEDCRFSLGEMNIKFRQIDLSDPFLGSYNPNRQIGSNYLNTKYSFVNIIKPNIWDSEYEYQYSMSKSNVNAIRRDTREIGINSYLGKNCYFNDNNDYVCELTRNKFETTTEWFKKADINR